jgi:hypothetical protein
MEFLGGIAAEATKGSIVGISSGLFQPSRRTTWRSRRRETASCVASNRARSEVSIRVVLQLSEGYLNGRLAVPFEAHDT